MSELQDQMILRMINKGFSPFSNAYAYASLFSRLGAVNISWVTLILPYEDNRLADYLKTAKSNLEVSIIREIVNGFTSSNKTRKHFRTFFSYRQHWLLKIIFDKIPDLIFDLIRRNEHHLMVPFLKHFKRELANLRNEKNQSLVEYAIQTRGVVEKTTQMLRNANLK